METDINLCFDNHIAEYYVNDNKNVNPIDLDKNFSYGSAEIFVRSILEFNDMRLNEDFTYALNHADEEIALEGGLHFSTPTIHIYPSCCSDFYDWTEMIHDIKNKISPWMGHDPSPNIEFFDNHFIVFSDDRKIMNSVARISFKNFELNLFIDKIQRNIEYSIPVIISWVKQNSSLDLKNFESALRCYMKGLVI